MTARCAWAAAATLLICLQSAPAQTPARMPIHTDRVSLGEPAQTIEGWGASVATWDEQSAWLDERWLATWQDLGLNIMRISLDKSVLQAADGRFDTPVPIGADLDENIARMNFHVDPIRVVAGHGRWLRDNALEPDRVLIVGSVWSPPHWMKGPTGARQNWIGITDDYPTPWLSGEHVEWQDRGRGDSIGGRLRTEDPELLRAYGRYVAAWVAGFERTWELPLHAISIQNESLFENPFDSMVVHVGRNGREDFGQYALLLDSVRSAWHEYGLTTRIKGPHPALIGPTPAEPWALTETSRLIEGVRRFDGGKLLNFLDYFNSNYYMPAGEGGAQTTAAFYRGLDAVDADWADWAYAPGVGRFGKPVWISEAGGEQTGWRSSDDLRDSREDGALTVAVKIFNALVHTHAVSYLYWLISDGEPVPGENSLLGMQQLDAPLDSAKYAAYRHFSRFVRPGARRLEATFDDGNSTRYGDSNYDALRGLSVAAFRHTEDDSLTLVALNMTDRARRIAVDLPADFVATDTQAWISTQSLRFESTLVTTDTPESFAADQAAIDADDSSAGVESERALVLELPPSSIATVFSRGRAVDAP